VKVHIEYFVIFNQVIMNQTADQLKPTQIAERIDFLHNLREVLPFS
jgi:hypothetical protein